MLRECSLHAAPQECRREKAISLSVDCPGNLQPNKKNSLEPSTLHEDLLSPVLHHATKWSTAFVHPVCHPHGALEECFLWQCLNVFVGSLCQTIQMLSMTTNFWFHQTYLKRRHAPKFVCKGWLCQVVVFEMLCGTKFRFILSACF